MQERKANLWKGLQKKTSHNTSKQEETDTLAPAHTNADGTCYLTFTGFQEHLREGDK